MLRELWNAISQWPIIIQGALGSALFWIVLEILRRTFSRIQRIIQKQKTRARTDTLIREYVYKKYTSHDGLAYYPQGYFMTFSHVFEYFLTGMLFFSLSLLGGGMTHLFLSIGLIGAIYYFSKALSWLIPDRSWYSQSILQRWERIAELEQTLFGKAYKDTQEQIAKLQQERDKDKLDNRMNGMGTNESNGH